MLTLALSFLAYLFNMLFLTIWGQTKKGKLNHFCMTIWPSNRNFSDALGIHASEEANNYHYDILKLISCLFKSIVVCPQRSTQKNIK
jgi:hypothetical protein